MFQYAKSFIGSLWSGKRARDDDKDDVQDQQQDSKDDQVNEPDQKRIRSEDGNVTTVHRIKVTNFNKKDWKKVKKYLLELGCNSMSKNPKWDYGIINASSEEEALDMMKKLENAKFKGKELKASHIRELKGDYTKRMEKNHRMRGGKVQKEKEAENDTRTPAEKLADQVTPLHKVPYEEQLKRKNNKGVTAMGKLKSQLQNIAKQDLTPKAIEQMQWATAKPVHRRSRMPCKMYDPIGSPEVNGYRTKCEFTIGKDLDGKPTVGFLLGLYKLGITAVLDPKDCLNVPEIAKRIASSMQDYIRNSEYPVYDRTEKIGVWRTLMTKTQRSGENMILIQVKTADLTEEQVDNEKKKLIEYWNSFQDKPEGEQLTVTTLLFQAWNGDSNGITDRAPIEVLTGDGIVHEELLGCKFRISASAFFQVNTPAAEVLYSKCAEWCRINKDKKTTLLDLCCGTGTIGITMAKSVDRVIGIEMVPEAIEDAKLNASINNIDNVTYYANKVEERMDVIGSQINEDVVAVLDPPRNGVHNSVIYTLRGSKVDRIIYISCDSKQALLNFFALCKPSSNRAPGEPFRPSRAISIDLFPHTDHCELMVEFVRGEYLKDLQEEEAQAAEEMIRNMEKKEQEKGKPENGEDKEEVKEEAKEEAKEEVKEEAKEEVKVEGMQEENLEITESSAGDKKQQQECQ
ncbi:S-adenosyl-L-methionine-dependent methyltransferase [Zychaea mexicana]|uniref:S-adenosyl-L-methionine-dependent methyltransferase n=1 Tax=Zychaea mexicana TaxID=64656 RepID=UPI0022FE312D|nr:S-adenosyl-L-methionine-dependent methyltransferase [Zychaea mexicana]KAI9494021.1 S-adenosyl-L-methionine-dependent methyltransferase [Zychaea mexicana]